MTSLLSLKQHQSIVNVHWDNPVLWHMLLQSQDPPTLRLFGKYALECFKEIGLFEITYG
jgi:hypothetical protein